ncbi:hypothetical protein Poly21_51810 [Allorhodopirellula heiligendammensis]|uniref:Uncharacterized protein n=1 Tax=Allorhodopirellula heiligendammensis TaxID=2714739 RepID=A0A5C6BFE3_9BACT|nr:hypothetical protein Poly21_51810 [Allorhodopirellula heiligendammensis]
MASPGSSQVTAAGHCCGKEFGDLIIPAVALLFVPTPRPQPSPTEPKIPHDAAARAPCIGQTTKLAHGRSPTCKASAQASPSRPFRSPSNLELRAGRRTKQISKTLKLIRIGEVDSDLAAAAR